VDDDQWPVNEVVNNGGSISCLSGNLIDIKVKIKNIGTAAANDVDILMTTVENPDANFSVLKNEKYYGTVANNGICQEGGFQIQSLYGSGNCLVTLTLYCSNCSSTSAFSFTITIVAG